jgi:dihydrofolate synthase/folylpolyglutamate synthase
MITHIDKEYESTVNDLFSMLPMYQRFGAPAYKANLDNTLALDKFYNHPHTAYKSIHVAGTNGKGSVSHMIASVLQSAGYKTGLYTSPHYLDFRERIKVNGTCVEKQFVIDFTKKSKLVIEKIKPSFFELTVMMAFDYFRQANVDIAVVEVGMGGRLDSTNIIRPELSVITNIGYDHQMFLGNTLPLIAKEKAGIIKPEVPVIIGETQNQTKHVFQTVAKEKNAEIIFADQHYSFMYTLFDKELNQHIHLKHGKDELELKTDLFGRYQQKNLITALTAIQKFKGSNPVSENAIFSGFKTVRTKTGMIGRFELLDTNPRFYCDAAHNAEGFKEVMWQVQQIPYKQLHLMLGFVKDKSIDRLFHYLPEDARYYFTQAEIPRALPANELAALAEKSRLRGDIFSKSGNALDRVRQRATSDDLIMASGSIFLVAEIIKAKKNVDSLCE